MDITITVCLVALMTAMYLTFPQFVHHSCTPAKYFDPKQWFISMFQHTSKGHFAYQIISFLGKGILLEGTIGSTRFASMVLKLLLTTEGMIVMAMQVWQLWGEGDIFLSICHGKLWRILFGMYGFLLPAYKNRNALVIVAIFIADIAFVYFLYPVIPLSGPVCGTLAGLLCSDAPKLIISYWKRTCISEASPIQQVEVLVWRCQSCTSENGAFLHVCDNCGEPREAVAHDNSVMDDLQSSSIRRMPNPDLTEPIEMQNSNTTGCLVWKCMSCTFLNGVFVHACEMCGTPRLMSDQNRES